MERLLDCYKEEFQNLNGGILDVFAEFYKLDLTPINSWLQKQFENKTVKNNEISTSHRKKGNDFYVKKDLTSSLESYTKSLCFAEPGSKEYGLALANRSAVTFELKEFRKCLKDIDLCFQTNYPVDLRPKIYLRKAECLAELGEKTALEKCVANAKSLLESINIIDKDKILLKLQHMENIIKPNNNNNNRNVENVYETPELVGNDENKNFAFASSKLKMSYNKNSGRHVLAATNIKRGDLLFVEKAFIFAPIFKDNKDLSLTKCYNCLKDIISGIPCKSCTLCVYCDFNCRQVSWNLMHKWECPGMQANIWYNLGIVLPAFRAMLKGIPSGFTSTELSFEDDLKKYGDKEDNYHYFDRLSSGFIQKDLPVYVISSAILISYLENYTEFFTWLLKQPRSPQSKLNRLKEYIGGVVTKHIAQWACNASTIEHWLSPTSEELFPVTRIPVACGIYPSVSIMNHACRPNITVFFICDTIVVKALENINENEEILNSYGIDYRYMKREQRQKTCKRLFYFECKCVICSNPQKELDMLDTYLCPDCRGSIPESKDPYSICLNCSKKFCLRSFRKTNSEAQRYLDADLENDNLLERLFRSLNIKEKILHRHHKDFDGIYYKLYHYYMAIGDPENILKYLCLWLENVQARLGENCKASGIKLYETSLVILHCLQNEQQPRNLNLKEFLEKVELMIKEAKQILNLYFPPYITNRLNN